ncbi:MAG: hypothetical protein AB8B70_11510 [Prochlorococcus sp.]
MAEFLQQHRFDCPWARTSEPFGIQKNPLAAISCCAAVSTSEPLQLLAREYFNPNAESSVEQACSQLPCWWTVSCVKDPFDQIGEARFISRPCPDSLLGLL